MTLPPVYPILDTGSLERLACPPLEAAEGFLEGGARILQLRHKAAWTRETYALAQDIARLCREAKAVFILNDRADYARLIGCGLHVGQEDLLPADARTLIGPEAILGFSTHNPAQLLSPETEPADYVAFGPVFPTLSKERADPTVGIEGLRLARTLTRKPLVAIGGITRDNTSICWGIGADSVAVIADLLPQPSNRNTVRTRMAEWIRLSASVYAGNQSVSGTR